MFPGRENHVISDENPWTYQKHVTITISEGKYDTRCNNESLYMSVNKEAIKEKNSGSTHIL